MKNKFKLYIDKGAWFSIKLSVRNIIYVIVHLTRSVAINVQYKIPNVSVNVTSLHTGRTEM